MTIYLLAQQWPKFINFGLNCCPMALTHWICFCWTFSSFSKLKKFLAEEKFSINEEVIAQQRAFIAEFKEMACTEGITAMEH